MGDRNNPIKFGPEWLRNLAREGNAGKPGNSNQNTMSPNSANPGASSNPSGSGNTASGSSSSHASPASQNTPKVQLAKLRYGREEMLALYDRTVEAPPELKFIELLYQPRGKAPFALNNTFEDDMQRDNARSGPPVGNSQGERYGIGRGMGRCLSVSDGRGRPRVPFVRQPSTGRGSSWHPGTPKAPGYSGGPEDDSPLNPRSSWTPNNGGNAPNRSSGEQAEWTPNKVFRSKRQGQATNWRQSREEGEEWRTSQDAGRSRSNQQEKWERDWGDRPTQDRPQSWNNNRRTWVGGDGQNNEENLPEWAVENAEACGGTFDSSGAFHGYSNDDTSLPKSPETPYPLTRSHTHGSFARSKTIEEGSEEWWASEKAKKLSPKRFDASDVKFRKQMSTPESSSDTFNEPKASTSNDDNQLQEVPVKLARSSAATEPDNASGGYSDDEKYHKNSVYKPKFSSESKTFDSHMRSDINLDEASDNQHERGGNFQSVMITPNNSLRQKHQNIVAAASEATRDIIARDKQAIFQLLQNAPTSQALENEMRKQQQATEDKIVDDIFDMTLEDKELLSKPKLISSPINHSSGNMSATMSSLANSMAQMPSPGMQQMRLASPHYSNQGLLLNTKQNIQNPGMQGGMPSGMQGLPSGMQGMQMPGLQMGGLPPTLQQVAGMQALNMQVNMQQPGGNQQQGMKVSMQSVMPGSMQAGMQGPMQSLQSVGMTNAALNASLGLPIGPVSNSMGLQLQGPPPVLPNSGMNAGMGGPGMQPLGPGGAQAGVSGMPGFPSGSLLGMSSANVANSSLFMGQNSNANSMNSGDIPMPNHGGQSNMYSMHGLQHSGSQAAFGSSIYSNMMQQPPSMPPPNPQILAEQWYYEDPEKNIQGPFSSSEMYKWYRAGFFSPSLMVRRAVDNHMRPLGSYGPVVPFLQMDVMTSFPMPGAFERTPGSHESMMNAQQALGLESKSRFQVDSLWSQPPPTNDLMWAQQAMGARNDARVNNLPMFFWDQQPSTIGTNTLLPEDITKEMKTEDQILAQLRASQNVSAPQNIQFMNEHALASQPSSKQEEPFSSTPSATPNLEELQKLIQADTLAVQLSSETNADNIEPKPGKPTKIEQSNETKVPQTKTVAEPKQTKSSKSENEKAAKNKENNTTKSKNKKKDEKKEELESKIKDEDNVKTERRSEETSPSNSKKEDKNKKDLEKEKKEWLKDGFTIVKGSEKNASKDNKKKVEEFKVAEEIERRRKETDRLAAEEDRKKKHFETIRKQEMQQQMQQRQAAESVVKKAPWSAVGNQSMMAPSKEGLTLAEIQRLEREKKLEQMKEQQQMMQIIAQQQAAALAREQELQAGLGWAKKKGTGYNTPGQSLAEIQAEARKQAAVAAAASAAAAAMQSFEELTLQPPIIHVPWGNGPNGGFWDTQGNQPAKAEKPQDVPKPGVSEVKPKKKVVPPVVAAPVKKETSPAIEFETWCTTVLASWSSKIDVPTFVGFLKDIESPYEVKDYVKCYLGDSKDTNDFSRNFLERRSKLLRVGMVTPSDDLCSPAIAVNPRTNSGSDYQEGKGKKTKKNKMLKVDARILGFSVTASEDRINVGDIDSV